jgi:hypothetical protein
MSQNQDKTQLFRAIILGLLMVGSPVAAEEKAMNHGEHDMLNEEVPKFNATGDEPM